MKSLESQRRSYFAGVVEDRIDVILSLVRQGSVLDIGCVDARTRRETSGQRLERKPDLLFRRLTELNPDTLGVDIDAEGCEALRRQGYAIVCANAETMDLGRTFDVIVAGEVIEHVENPGLFLRNVRKHLAPDGLVVLTTPNPFSCRYTWKIWRYGEPAVHEDHTCWFDPITLEQLLRRTGLEPTQAYWLQPKRRPLLFWKRYFRPYFAAHFLMTARPAA